ncbi:MAG TPA: hypothetical protein VJV78_20160 [Polyangiales bacterium]|nr:hypothetical protein [Polyangiales bacterium]
MTALSTISPLAIEGVVIRVENQTVFFEGVISMRSPAETVTPHLRKIHAAAVQDGVKNLTADLGKLRFMNSSSIRSLVDWVEWIRNEADNSRYVLHFVSKPDVTWQRTTLAAIQTLGGPLVVVHSGG